MSVSEYVTANTSSRWNSQDRIRLDWTSERILFLSPNNQIDRPGTTLIIKETGVPDFCDDVALLESYASDDFSTGAAPSGADSVLSMLPQEARKRSPMADNKIACGFLSICSSCWARLKTEVQIRQKH